MKDLFVVGRAIGMLECGRSISFVSRQVNASRRTVRRWLSVFRNNGTVVRRKPTGRPKKTNDRSNRLLHRIANVNRFVSCPMLRRLWGENVSCNTVRRRLKGVGFRQYRCALKPLLSPANRVQRYEWCRNHAFWPLERFQRIAWSDESRFRLLVNDGRVRVWRQRGERFRSDLVQRTVQAGAGSVHVWGAIWHDGRSVLKILRQTVNGEVYCGIIRSFLDDRRLPAGRWKLQQDNAPAHRSVLVQNFLAESGVEVIPWPSRSPDLNPIENVWDYLGRKIQLRNPANLRQLGDFLVQEWDLMPQAYVNVLVASMARRVRAVIEVNGGSTRY